MSKSKQIAICLLLFSFTVSLAQKEILVPNRVGNLWGFKSMKGNKEIKAVYDSVCHFSHYLGNRKASDFAKVKKGNLWGLIDTKGEIVVPIAYKQLYQPNQKNPDYYIAKNDQDKFGALYDKKNIIPFEYDSLGYTKNYITAYKANKIGIIDVSGTVKIPLIYDQILYIRRFKSTSDVGRDWNVNDDELIHSEAGVRIKLPKTLKPDQAFHVWTVSNTNETKHLITNQFQELSVEKYIDDKDYENEIKQTPIATSRNTKSKSKTKNSHYDKLVLSGYFIRQKYNPKRRYYVFSKRGSSKKGLYDMVEKRELIPPLYTSIFHTQFKSKHFFSVKDGRKSGLFDVKGKEIFPATAVFSQIFGSVYAYGDKKSYQLFSMRTDKKSIKYYNVLKKVTYNEFQKNRQNLIAVEENGIVFYVDENMNEYYTK